MLGFFSGSTPLSPGPIHHGVYWYWQLPHYQSLGRISCSPRPRAYLILDSIQLSVWPTVNKIKFHRDVIIDLCINMAKDADFRGYYCKSPQPSEIFEKTFKTHCLRLYVTETVPIQPRHKPPASPSEVKPSCGDNSSDRNVWNSWFVFIGKVEIKYSRYKAQPPWRSVEFCGCTLVISLDLDPDYLASTVAPGCFWVWFWDPVCFYTFESFQRGKIALQNTAIDMPLHHTFNSHRAWGGNEL